MASLKRYVEDSRLSIQAIRFVRKNGGTFFFKNRQWKKDIKHFFSDCKKGTHLKDRMQTYSERFEEVKQDLQISKQMIEEKLNKQVNHLCYPWFKGCPMSVAASKEVGYKGNFWGIVSKKAINKTGDDSYYLKRISSDFILTLPGKERLSLLEILAVKHFRKKVLDK